MFVNLPIAGTKPRVGLPVHVLQCTPPASHVLRSFSLFMPPQVVGEFTIWSCQIPRIHLVEDCTDGLWVTSKQRMLNDLREYVQAPYGRCVVLRYHNNDNIYLVDSHSHLRGHPSVSRLLVFVYVSTNPSFIQLTAEMADKSPTGVLLVKTQEHWVRNLHWFLDSVDIVCTEFGWLEWWT